MGDINLDKNAIRQQMAETLKLELTDTEIDTLFAGEPLTFDRLMQNRSLSEIGVALIRADALQPDSLIKTEEVPLKRFCVSTPKGEVCIDMRTASIRLDA